MESFITEEKGEGLNQAVVCFEWEMSVDEVLEFARSGFDFHGKKHDRYKGGAIR